MGDADCGQMIADCGSESAMKLKHKLQLEESPHWCMDHARCCVPGGGIFTAGHAGACLLALLRAGKRQFLLRIHVRAWTMHAAACRRGDSST